ncbi:MULTISPECIES: hypothetical protein [Burkholderiaceae]|uniref:hypothetical protein n=1 Tax=Burkholderiaceae TaxID=119060 RepID=UPI000961B699|nr:MULTISPECIES: hypothetical protein [Burkholderiaceae]MCG1019244.1 hypothetical protein [Mycetohabitans sp. B4]SIT72775.1 hypothetical protein SAMN04487768_2613 [Burkholderia sp. b13]
MRYSPLPVLRAHADDAPTLLEQVGGYLEEWQNCVMNLKVQILQILMACVGWPPVRCPRFDYGRMAATLRKSMPSV